MTATIKTILGALAGALVLLTAGVALAGGNCGCSPPPPPTCCTPPSPPTPPSTPPCCQPPGHTINIPGVTINVGGSLVVNATVSASGSATASGSASGSGSGFVVFSGGGGGGGYGGPGATSLLQNLTVSGGDTKRSAFEATRTRTIKVVIQANCIDDKDVPHPASQVTPDRDIDDAYDGEIYRCIAGTHMQYVFAQFNGQIAFDHGQTVDCVKGQALYHAPGGKLECQLQKPARDCNERSLLRRFGAGVKVLTMVTIERYTEYREESVQSQGGGSLSLDGGVGGMVY